MPPQAARRKDFSINVDKSRRGEIWVTPGMSQFELAIFTQHGDHNAIDGNVMVGSCD